MSTQIIPSPPEGDTGFALPAQDYVSPGLDVIMPDFAFPDMVIGDTSTVDWPFLRAWVDHNWYTDRTASATGFANRDEAMLLYNNAKLFPGRPSLEIGCWRGWSAVHIAKGTGMLDVIDPLIANEDIAAKVRSSLASADVLDMVALHPGSSPEAVDALAQTTGRRWSFFFIDGNHDGAAPARDAEAVLRHSSLTSMVMFHDLTSPDVAAGLQVFRDAGWRTMVYQTMQIMGVAWRGDVTPVHHIPDPRIFWTLPRHLSGYEVSGWNAPRPAAKARWWTGMSMADRLKAALIRAQAAEDDVWQARADIMTGRTEIASRDAKIQTVHAEVIGLKAQLSAAIEQIGHEVVRADLASAERDAALDRAAASEMSLTQLSDAIVELKKTIPEYLSIEAERGRLICMLNEANRELEELHCVNAANETLQKECNELSWRVERAEHKFEILQLKNSMQENRFDEIFLINKKLVDLVTQDVHSIKEFRTLAWWVSRKRNIFGLMRRSAYARLAIFRQQTATLGISDDVSEAAMHQICRRRTLFGLLRRTSRHSALLVESILLANAEHVRRQTALEISKSMGLE